jgi:F1F0 ATPase subunit 2
MDETLALVRAGMTGALLGAFFYGGLWLTVRRGLSSGRPALWFVASLLLRTGVTLACFYLVSRAHWERLPPCVLGFFVASVTVTAWTRAPKRKPVGPAREAVDAPHS